MPTHLACFVIHAKIEEENSFLFVCQKNNHSQDLNGPKQMRSRRKRQAAILPKNRHLLGRSNPSSRPPLRRLLQIFPPRKPLLWRQKTPSGPCPRRRPPHPQGPLHLPLQSRRSVRRKRHPNSLPPLLPLGRLQNHFAGSRQNLFAPNKNAPILNAEKSAPWKKT